MINEIENLIKSKMNIIKISIADFSNNHKNHSTYEGGGHYQAVIISDDFKDLSLLERHKKIYSILGDLMTQEIHAFSMKTYTNDEFQKLDHK
tara:strand:- start:1979 stop:2254 length:276 start_codon:yes stop_codon:yes gene_type:complete